MKKILFISNEASYTGAPIFLIKLVRHLKENANYKLSIFFAKSGGLSQSLEDLDVNVFVSQKSSIRSNRFGKLFLRVFHYIRYIRILLISRPDLVYSNTIINAGEVVIAGLLRIPVILHVHEGQNVASLYRFRLVVSCYFASRIIVGSNYVGRILYSLTKRHGDVIYIGVKSTNIPVVWVPHIDGPFLIGMIGTINPNKGQHVAIKALRILLDKGFDVQLIIAGVSGDNAYLEEIVSLVNALYLERYVIFLGAVLNAEDFISSLDILLLPSYDEALPTVVLEAFSMGTIVVASNVGGIPEIIDDGVDGFLFVVGDERMLSVKIEEIIKNNKMLNDIANLAGRKLLEKFDISENNKKIEICIGSVLDEY